MPDVWPISLPDSFTFESYGEGIADGRLRSQTDTGPGKIRPRSSAMPEPLSGQMAMTGAQLETLRTFVKTTIAGGSLPFLFKSQRGGAQILVRFGDELPSWQRQGAGRYLVSLKLEIMP
jgi:hypothetical protein